jgi:16S rRNA (guanine527-N7)-methyltransferase
VKQVIQKFKRVSESLGLDIGTNELEKFITYQKELSRWNKKINLISRKSDSPQDIFRHILDSLLIFKAVKVPFKAKLLDFGSGAGFPGIPIKIFREDICLTLLESKKKKAFFLEQMLKTLKLKNSRVVCARADDLADFFEFQGSYDLVTAKATGKLMDVIPLIYPFLKIDGLFVAYKGRTSKDEIEELSPKEKLKIQEELILKVQAYNLTRRLVVIKKTQ